MTPLVPSNHPPPTGCKQRSKDIEGAREVRTTVGKKQWVRVRCTPLVNSDINARRADDVLTVGSPCTFECDGVVAVGHHPIL